jgi:hypothetical protein
VAEGGGEGDGDDHPRRNVEAGKDGRWDRTNDPARKRRVALQRCGL